MKEFRKITLEEANISNLTLELCDPYGKWFMNISEGCGDNLWEDDINEGYIDYAYITVYGVHGTYESIEENDGGMMMLKEYYVDKYSKENIEDLIRDSLQFMAEDMFYTVDALPAYSLIDSDEFSEVVD